MDEISSIIVPSNNHSELDKLRSANQLANQLLERSKENCLIKVNHDIIAEKAVNGKFIEPCEEITQGVEKLGEVTIDPTCDNWGAKEYLQDTDHFRFVADYLNRTEKLLKKRNPVKVLSTSSSYEIVNSSDDLLQNRHQVPTAVREINPIIFAEDDTAHVSNTSPKPQSYSKTKSKDFLVSNVFQNESIDTNLNPDAACVFHENELVTHRPDVSIGELNVFTPMFDNECQQKNSASQKGWCDRAQDLHVFETSQSNNNSILRKIPSHDLSHTVIPSLPCDTSQKKQKVFDNAWTTPDSMKEDHMTKTTNEPSNSLPVTLSDNRPTSDDLPQTGSSPLFGVLFGNMSASDVLLGSTGHDTKILEDGGLENTNDDLANEAMLLNAEEELNLNQDVEGTRNLNQPPKERSELNIPQLLLSDESDTEAPQPTVNRGTKTRRHAPLFSVKQRQRPASAGQKRVLPVTNNAFMGDLRKVPCSAENVEKVPTLSRKSPEKLKRPASAGKLQAALRSTTSPKRVWEKSSIAWGSYGKGQLSTWSSVNLSSAKLPSTNGTIAVLKQISNARIQKIKNNRHSVNLFAHAMPQPSQKIWLQLPDEILIHIFSFLPLKDLLNVAKVCKRFCQISVDSYLWRRVEVSGMTLTNQWLMTIGRKGSESISLANCCGKGVTGIGLRNFFKNLKCNLTHLHIGNCTGSSLTGDSILLHVSCHCRNLRHVSIPWSKTTDNGLMAICLALAALESINITGNPAVTDEAFHILKDKHSKSLKFLEMAGCFAVSNDTLVSLVKKTTSLQTLNIGLCNKVTTEGIKLLSDHLPMLQHLDLRGIKSVTNSSLHFIATKCKRLRTLIISNCASISDVGLAEISTYLDSLTHLDISGCSLVSDQGITNYISNAQCIEYLDLSSTGATHVSVDMLIECNHETIKVLKLSFCNNITHSCLVSLLNVAVKLKSLHLYGCKRLKLSALMKVNKNVVIEK